MEEAWKHACGFCSKSQQITMLLGSLERVEETATNDGAREYPEDDQDSGKGQIAGKQMSASSVGSIGAASGV